MTMSTVIPSKSVGDFVTKRSVAFLRECGHEMSKITLKTDQEPAIVSLRQYIAASRSGGTSPLDSPVRCSRSNGRMENAVNRFQGHVRVLSIPLNST